MMTDQNRKRLLETSLKIVKVNPVMSVKVTALARKTDLQASSTLCCSLHQGHRIGRK